MKSLRTPYIAMRIAAAYAGSGGEMAEMLGVNKAVMSKWMTRGYPPIEYVKRISDITGGDVAVEDLVPNESQIKAD